MIAIIVIFIILLIVALFSNKKSNIFIAFGLIDVFLRIIDYIGNHTIGAINNIINKIFPSSIAEIIANNSSGVLQDIIMWAYVLLMSIFFYYVLRLLIKRL